MRWSDNYKLITFSFMRRFILPVRLRLEMVGSSRSVGGFHSLLLALVCSLRLLDILGAAVDDA
jgi:hypothetical protein